MQKCLAALLFCVIVSLGQAAELTLFDLPLRTASREQIGNAIVKAGGRLKSSSADIDRYEASRIGLPGATSLEVIYLDGKLVLARYELDLNDKTDERVRKMLVVKYGQPRGETGFDAQYGGGGTHRWFFDSTMELVFTRDSFSSPSQLLAYVNRTEQVRLERLVREQDKRAAEREAAARKSVF